MTSSLRDRIRECLSGHPQENVARFVESAATIQALASLAPTPARNSERRKSLEQIAKAADALVEAVGSHQGSLSSDKDDMTRQRHQIAQLARVIEDAGGAEAFFNSIEEGRRPATTGQGESAEPAEIDDIATHAMTTAGVLARAAREEMERFAIRAGRNPADADGMLTEIAFAYVRILGAMPTSTEGGPFYQIAVITTGLTDPSRPVLTAIARVREQLTK